MQIYIPNLHITGATFDCGKFGSAEVAPVEHRESVYDLDIHVLLTYRKNFEEARLLESIIQEIISERLNARTFEPDGTTNIESDVDLMYLLAYLED